MRLDDDSTRLVCTQTIQNVSQRSTHWCHWSRTLATGGGVCLVPLAGPSRFPKDYVMYPSGDLIQIAPHDPNIRLREGFLEIFGPPRYPKLGMDSTAGWFAYLAPNNVAFIKRFPVYADRVYNEVAGLTVSIYYDDRLRCELEPIGPRETLSPGQSSSFTEEWYLADFPFPGAGQQADLGRLRRLVEAVPPLHVDKRN